MQLELNAGEAIFALDAITKAGTEAHRTRRFLIATHAPADERAVVDLTAEVLDRLELRLRNLLFPACEWGDCDQPRGSGNYCDLHASGRVPTYAREGR